MISTGSFVRLDNLIGKVAMIVGLLSLIDLPSLDFFFLVDSSSLLELSGLVHKDERRQRGCREHKFLGVHII